MPLTIAPVCPHLLVLISFLLGLPGLINPGVLAALFSLTATGLYASYMIPILLRVTVAKDTFKPLEFNLGVYSIPFGYIAVAWASFMTIVLCLPQSYPVNVTTLNYSPLVLGGILFYAVVAWYLSAKYWYKTKIADEIVRLSNSSLVSTGKLSEIVSPFEHSNNNL